MYDNEDDLNITIPRILRISIVNPLVPKVDLSKKYQKRQVMNIKNV